MDHDDTSARLDHPGDGGPGPHRRRREKKDLPALPLVRFELLEEGTCAQILHRGPYADEPPNIRRLHEFIAAQGLRLTGRHHEIYLNAPGRGDPARMKTLIRQPVAPG